MKEQRGDVGRTITQRWQGYRKPGKGAPPSLHVSVFEPNGDMIAPHEDNTLVRYCRQP